MRPSRWFEGAGSRYQPGHEHEHAHFQCASSPAAHPRLCPGSSARATRVMPSKDEDEPRRAGGGSGPVGPPFRHTGPQHHGSRTMVEAGAETGAAVPVQGVAPGQTGPCGGAKNEKATGTRLQHRSDQQHRHRHETKPGRPGQPRIEPCRPQGLGRRVSQRAKGRDTPVLRSNPSELHPAVNWNTSDERRSPRANHACWGNTASPHTMTAAAR